MTGCSAFQHDQVASTPQTSMVLRLSCWSYAPNLIKIYLPVWVTKTGGWGRGCEIWSCCPVCHYQTSKSQQRERQSRASKQISKQADKQASILSGQCLAGCPDALSDAAEQLVDPHTDDEIPRSPRSPTTHEHDI